VTILDRAGDAAVRRLPGMDDDQRADIAATLRSLGDDRPRSRWREVASVLWLGSRLRSRADTGDLAGPAVRQGLHRGATALAAMGAADGGSGTAIGAFVAATWLAARGQKVLATAAISAGAAATWSAVPTDDALPIVLRSVIAVAALSLASSPAGARPVLCPWRWALLAGAVAAVGASVDPDVAVSIVVVALSVGWLASSSADPRLAVGAAVLLFWRLVAVDVHELADGTVALATGPELDLVVVRWTAMVAGLGAAVVVARSAMRRATTI
jgi:hypothetical protein